MYTGWMSPRFMLGLLVFTAACEKFGTVGAVVVDPAGAPVAGASVRISCPDHAFGDGEEAVTHAKGQFLHHSIPDIHETCLLTIQKAGFVSKTLQRKDVAYGGGMSTDGPLPTVQLQLAK